MGVEKSGKMAKNALKSFFQWFKNLSQNHQLKSDAIVKVHVLYPNMAAYCFCRSNLILKGAGLQRRFRSQPSFAVVSRDNVRVWTVRILVTICW